MALETIQVSVRALVESVLLSGDIIAAGIGGMRRMLEGQRGHKVIQEASAAKAEVSVSTRVAGEKTALEISGRIDMLTLDGDMPHIEEIKTTHADLDTLDAQPVHWAQAECYAHMLCLRDSLPRVRVTLIYLHVRSEETRRFAREYSAAEAAARFDAYVQPYLRRAEALSRWHEARDATIAALSFPYDAYRDGQRAMAANAYVAFRDGKSLLVDAPTGIGKTAAALFPALKALGEGLIRRIFYVTARTTARLSAQAALDAMRARGLRARSVCLTAKEKICPYPQARCHPDECPRAKGYYDRVTAALEAAAEREAWGREDIAAFCDARELCPFEFQLDVSLQCDCIIGDYNYVFDPRVKLRRYFESGSGYGLLVDEAHHLPDRAREMHSAQLASRELKALRPGLAALGRKHPLAVSLRALNRECAGIRKALTQDAVVPLSDALLRAAEDFADEAESAMAAGVSAPGLMEAFFAVRWFLTVAASVDDRYAVIACRDGRDLMIELLCLDASREIRAALRPMRGSVFFSATLLPLPFYRDVLGLKANTGLLTLASPFPVERFLVLAHPLRTTYAARESSRIQVARAIEAMCRAHVGNYLAFFPSYRYMVDVADAFEGEGLDVLRQERGMDEAAREAFLDRFQAGAERSLVGFAVMGSLFGEGIDLPGERLHGVAIVGVGLPQLCVQRDELRRRLQERYGAGFEYAYQYPGMCRVQQAMGRVIRDAQDRGVCLLLDERFLRRDYAGLLPAHWTPRLAPKPADVVAALEAFWGREA